MTLLVLLIAVTVATAVHLAGTVIAARLMRVPVGTASFGIGPTLGTFKLGTMPVAFKLVPLAGSLSFITAADAPPGLRAFEDLGRAQKIAIAVSGCVACVIVACVLLGPQAGWRETAASWGELFRVLSAFPDVGAQWKPVLA